MGNEFYNDFDHETHGGERKSDNRSVFQIDRDRIAFSYPFRRLQSKTQVFQTGEFDFYRTRLTHSIEVARIGRSICENLNRISDALSPGFHIDPDLVEAVCLAHDIGHPPFGHIGERKLNELMAADGGFEGNAQTLRIVCNLIFEGRRGAQGMAPSRGFLDGILKYKKTCEALATDEGKHPENHFVYDSQADILSWTHDLPLQDIPKTKSLECQIMDWADDTAYSLHDIVDGIKAGFLTQRRIEKWGEKADWLTPHQQTLLGELLHVMKHGNPDSAFARKVGDFIRGAVLKEANDNSHPLSSQTNRYRYRIVVDKGIEDECKLYKRMAYELIFQSQPIQLLEFKSGYLLEKLFRGISDNYNEKTPLVILPENVHQQVVEATERTPRMRLICDYISALTDPMAQRLYQRMFSPDFGSIIDRDL